MKSLHIGLAADLIKKIDRICQNNSLKRSTVVRLHLIRALSNLSGEESTEFKDLSMIFDKKLSNEVVPISLQIPNEINEKLERLREYVPMSKKKLAEWLIIREIEKMQEEQAAI